jgi:O-antigen/teichoic acid export membrane protein
MKYFKSIIKKILSKSPLDRFSSTFIKAISGTFLIQILGMGMAYIFMIILTRTYGAEVFGLYSLAFVIMNISSILTRLGFDSSAVKFIPSFQNNISKIKGFYFKGLLLISVLSVTITAILYFLAPTLSSNVFKKGEDLIPYIEFSSFSLAPLAFTLFNAEVLRGLGKATWQVAFRILAVPLIGCLILSSAVFLNLELLIHHLYIIIILIVCLVSFIVVFFNIKPKSNDKNFLAIEPNYKEILDISIPMFLFTSLLLVSEWINTILLGLLGSTDDVAIYKVIFAVSGVVLIVIHVVSIVIAPIIASMFNKNDIVGLVETVDKFTNITVKLSLFIIVIIAALSKFVLLLFGKDFIEGTYPLCIILAGQIWQVWFGFGSLVLNMCKWQRYVAFLSLIKIVIVIVGGVCLIPQLGILGVAISSAISNVFFNILASRKVKKELNFWPIYVPKIRKN